MSDFVYYKPLKTYCFDFLNLNIRFLSPHNPHSPLLYQTNTVRLEVAAFELKAPLLCRIQERLEALMKRSLERSLQLEQRTKRWGRGCLPGAGKDRAR